MQQWTLLDRKTNTEFGIYESRGEAEAALADFVADCDDMQCFCHWLQAYPSST